MNQAFFDSRNMRDKIVWRYARFGFVLGLVAAVPAAFDLGFDNGLSGAIVVETMVAFTWGLAGAFIGACRSANRPVAIVVGALLAAFVIFSLSRWD